MFRLAQNSTILIYNVHYNEQKHCKNCRTWCIIMMASDGLLVHYWTLLYEWRRQPTKAAFLRCHYNSDFGSMHSASEMRIRVLAAILPISPDRSRRFIVCRFTPDKSASSRAVMPRFMRYRSNFVIASPWQSVPLHRHIFYCIHMHMMQKWIGC